MPRTQQIQAEDECAVGSKKMESFFKPGSRPGFPGRPKGSKKKQKKKRPRKGQLHTAAVDAAVPVPVPVKSTALAVQPVRVEPVAKRPKLPRVQWSLPENAALMQEYVEDWLEKKGRYDEGMNMLEYCARIPGLTKGTFAQYANQRGKAKVVGNKPGRPRLFSPDDEQIIVDCTVRADRGNNGKTTDKIVDMCTELRPDITRRQVYNAFGRTIHPSNKDKLSGKVQAQATTTKRSAITVEQQYR